MQTPDRSLSSAPTSIVQLMLLTSAVAGIAASQSIPASITTVNQPTSGRAVFDSAGNVYYASEGPVTSGAAQTQPGGGTCHVATGFIGDVPEPCPDAGIVKVDPSGNEIWGTLLGGPKADIGSALAIDAAGNVLITGSTGGQFPTTPGAAIPTSSTAMVFAAKVSAGGRKVLYSTYLPAIAATSATIAVDAQDNAYIAGKSSGGLCLGRGADHVAQLSRHEGHAPASARRNTE
jgi:Beta-propeller repeat